MDSCGRDLQRKHADLQYLCNNVLSKMLKSFQPGKSHTGHLLSSEQSLFAINKSQETFYRHGDLESNKNESMYQS